MSSWWLNKQGAKKVILWDDTTHISISAARDAHLNRHTNSAYYAYAGNVAKGAVFLQLCSWMGTWELNYGLERFLRRNIKLEAASLSTCIGLLIISTKEFHSPSLLTRGIAVSWQLGERETSCFSNLRLQGAIESSKIMRSIDRQQWHQRENKLYKSCILSTELERPPNLVRDTGICSTSTMTSDRSGNENAVNVAKRPDAQKRALRPNESLKVIADA